MHGLGPATDRPARDQPLSYQTATSRCRLDRFSLTSLEGVYEPESGGLMRNRAP